MKVKIITEQTLKNLENEVNSFIEGKKINDIKYTESGDFKTDRFWVTALIMYEE